MRWAVVSTLLAWPMMSMAQESLDHYDRFPPPHHQKAQVSCSRSGASLWCEGGYEDFACALEEPHAGPSDPSVDFVDEFGRSFVFKRKKRDVGFQLVDDHAFVRAKRETDLEELGMDVDELDEEDDDDFQPRQQLKAPVEPAQQAQPLPKAQHKPQRTSQRRSFQSQPQVLRTLAGRSGAPTRFNKFAPRQLQRQSTSFQRQTFHPQLTQPRHGYALPQHRPSKRNFGHGHTQHQTVQCRRDHPNMLYRCHKAFYGRYVCQEEEEEVYSEPQHHHGHGFPRRPTHRRSRFRHRGAPRGYGRGRGGRRDHPHFQHGYGPPQPALPQAYLEFSQAIPRRFRLGPRDGYRPDLVHRPHHQGQHFPSPFVGSAEGGDIDGSVRRAIQAQAYGHLHPQGQQQGPGIPRDLQGHRGNAVPHYGQQMGSDGRAVDFDDLKAAPPLVDEDDAVKE